MSLLNEAQAAEYLSIPKVLLQKLCREHRIPFVQLSERKRAFKAEQLQAFIDSCSVEPKHRIDVSTRHLVRSKTMKGGESKKSKSSGREEGPSTIRKELKELCQ
jgi:excisionase family DNA binding protein